MVDNFLSPFLQKDFNPKVFLSPVRLPIHVPPEDFQEWTEHDERDFAYWQGKGDSKCTKQDYMDFLHIVNSEFNIDEVFVKLKEGFEAFGKLLSCMKQFPNYNLLEDLEESYTLEENIVMREFIKFGVFVKKRVERVDKFLAFVKKHDLEVKESVELSQLNSTLAENIPTPSVEDKDTIKDTFVDKMQQETVQLSQMDTLAEDSNLTHRTPVVKKAVKTKQGNEEKRRRKKRIDREKRQERLLEFHEN